MTRRAGMIWTFPLATACLLLSRPAKAQKFEFAYVANGASNIVSVIDTATNKVTATIPVGVFPWGVGITPDGRFAYVVNSGLARPETENCTAGTVSVIDTATNSVIATTPVDRSPEGIAISRDGASAYVASTCDNTVSVIDTATNALAATIETHALTPSRIALTSDGAFAYTTTGTSHDVTVVDTATRVAISTIPVGGCPYGIAIQPDGSFAYVANLAACPPVPPNVGPGSISVIDTASKTVVATTLDFPFGFPNFVAITPDGASAWVTNCDLGVCVIDTATNAVTATFATSTTSAYNLGIAFTKDGKSAYVACYGTPSGACVIDTATHALTATIPVGGSPTDIAVASVQLFSLDHFKCYSAKTTPGSARFPKRAVILADEFETKSTTVVKPVSFCTPVDKDGQSIPDAAAHLECYQIKDAKGQAKFAKRNVRVESTQLDVGALTASKSDTLCLPARSDGQSAALGLDNFKCYAAKTAVGTAKFAQRTVTLADEFETKSTKLLKPVSVCNPAGQDGAGITTPLAHLECYRISDVKGQPKFTARNVPVQNAFGSETLTVQKPDTLCVPSLQDDSP